MEKPTKKSTHFLWGVATAAHQVEGSQENDWSIWESQNASRMSEIARTKYADLPNWSEIKSAINSDANYISGTCADHFHRYPEDIAIMKRLKINSYRFSIEWSRIEPEPGEFDAEALTHYREVVSDLQDAGITPFITLHHFTNPVWLEDHGGWHGASFPDLFARFVAYVVENLAVDVKYFVTINEPESYLISRYLDSPIWPAWPNQERSLRRYHLARKNYIQAHKLAYAVIKRHIPGAQVGFSHGIVWFEGRGLSDLLARLLNRHGGTGLYRKLADTQDFLGLQYYMRNIIRISWSHPLSWSKMPDAQKQSDVGWEIYPEGLSRILRKLKKYRFPIYITENGIADSHDALRGEFITRHVDVVAQACKDGVDVRGYFYWSLLDNYEWSSGHWPQFGLVAYDPVSKARKIRQSAWVYRSIIEASKEKRDDPKQPQ